MNRDDLETLMEFHSEAADESFSGLQRTWDVSDLTLREIYKAGFKACLNVIEEKHFA